MGMLVGWWVVRGLGREGVEEGEVGGEGMDGEREGVGGVVVEGGGVGGGCGG